MKLYPNLNVELFYQNCGSQWLMILRGPQESILLAFNGLWNYGATSGELDFTDHSKTVAKFWSDEKRMIKYFRNRFLIGHQMGEIMASSLAKENIEKLKLEQEKFLCFNRKQAPDGFDMGVACAERPDSDFRDTVLVHALRDKTSVREVERTLAK